MMWLFSERLVFGEGLWQELSDFAWFLLLAHLEGRTRAGGALAWSARQVAVWDV